MTHTLEKKPLFQHLFRAADSDKRAIAGKNLLGNRTFTHKKMQSRIFTKNRPLKS